MKTKFFPIGYVESDVEKVPRHYTVSDVRGKLVFSKQIVEGLKDIKTGQRIFVIFQFHKSDAFKKNHLTQKPTHRNQPRGIFSTCSPIRPNPIGLSVLEVTGVSGNIIEVKGLDMITGTPILDIKPYTQNC